MSLSLRRRTPAPAPVAAPVKTLPFGGIHRLIRWEWHTYGAGYMDVGETVKVAETVTAADATHITSQLAARPGMHLPTLDIDLPAELRDSSTPGHHHLLLNHPMTWRQYKRLLRALARAGVVEKSWVKASIRSGFTCVRIAPDKEPDRGR